MTYKNWGSELGTYKKFIDRFLVSETIRHKIYLNEYIFNIRLYNKYFKHKVILAKTWYNHERSGGDDDEWIERYKNMTPPPLCSMRSCGSMNASQSDVCVGNRPMD